MQDTQLRLSESQDDDDSLMAGSLNEDEAGDHLLKDSPEVSSFDFDDGDDLRRHQPRGLLSFFSRRRYGCQRSNPASKSDGCKRRKWRLCTSFFVVVLAIYGLFSLFELFIGLGPLIWSEKEDPFLPNWGEAGEPGEGHSGYPTDFTRDIVPIPCHSHNDYWRRVPLYEAIHYGCTSVEADVWLFDGELYIGHSTSSLTRNRTFQSLYVDPLIQIVDKQNPSTDFVNGTQTRNGVFDEDPEQTLVLLVDFKTNGEELFPVVESQISTLRDRDYLSYFNGKTFISRPITVVATGNAPFNLINANETYRDIFFDAPLHLLSSPLSDPPSTSGEEQGTKGIDLSLGGAQFKSQNSYYASTDFISSIGFPWRGDLSPAQLTKLRQQIKNAKDRGLKSRYWNTPTWPIGLRNHIWSVLVREGVAVLNVDDTRSASKGDWRRRIDRDW